MFRIKLNLYDKKKGYFDFLGLKTLFLFDNPSSGVYGLKVPIERKEFILFALYLRFPGIEKSSRYGWFFQGIQLEYKT